MLQTIMEHSDSVANFVVALLGAIVSRFVWNRIKTEGGRQVLQRAYAEIADAVLLVFQTYVADLKRQAADGALTEAQRDEAKRRAVATVTKNLGETGMDRLARVLGVNGAGRPVPVDAATAWVEEKTESTIGGLKMIGALGVGPTGATAPSVAATLRAVAASSGRAP